MKVLAPISTGELIDKITILELKLRHIVDERKRANVQYELGELSQIWGLQGEKTELTPIVEKLRQVNASLWDIEDKLRALERVEDFGAEFVQSARSVYKLNDERSALKHQINTMTGSQVVEEKSYH